MNDGQSNQSVKDILEDIKKAISSKNASSGEVKIEKEKKDDDLLYLKEGYLEDSEEDSKEEDNEKTTTVRIRKGFSITPNLIFIVKI